MRAFILKLQNLSETKKKIVLLSVIGVSVLALGFFQVPSTIKQVAVIGESVQSIKLPPLQMADNGSKLKDISKVIDDLKTDGSGGLLADWQTYKSEEYGFEMSHPSSWKVDAAYTGASEVTLLQLTEKEAAAAQGLSGPMQAGLHLELIEATSAADGLDAMIVKMKDIVMPKKSITVGLYSGYEVIGSFCVGACIKEKEDIYRPFSIIYFTGENGQVFEIQYGESSETGWKTSIDEWKRYEQFKEIISTFNYSVT